MRALDNHHSTPDKTDSPGDGLVACHECDLLQQVHAIPPGAKALCHRCGALLYRHVPNSLERALALNFTALMLFVLANAYPFLSLKVGGRMEENVLLSGVLAFYHQGMGELAVLVFLTSFLFPLLTISGMLYVLISMKSMTPLPAALRVYRLVRTLSPWSLVGVFMLAVLVAIVKLLDLATVIPGVSLFALAALLLAATAARSNLDEAVLWSMRGTTLPAATAPTAAEQGLVSCHTCGLLVETMAQSHAEHTHDHGQCPRCESALHSRKHNSLNRTWALLVSAMVLFIPANVYPVMTVTQLGKGEPNTIISGVIHLIQAGMWPLAMLIFFASIVVPMLKMIVLCLLLVTVQKGSEWRRLDRARLYRITEVVGAWSMVDVFLVGILIALVNIESLATIRPGLGVTFFAAVVTITMFAAHSFDPRLIWDERNPQRHEHG